MSSVNTDPPLGTDELCSAVYLELKNVAAWHLSTTHDNITLDATDLVHESISRVLKQRRVLWNDRAHLLAIASIMIRRVLINHIQHRSATVRAGWTNRQEMLMDPQTPRGIDECELLVLNEALERLEEIDERQARIVEMKFFGGLTSSEIASYLDVSERTVQLSWNHARLWLIREMSDE